MENIIKTNVTDCILDKKRSVVEISTKGNQAGKELVEILRANIPSELIKDIRYTFGTRDIEVVTHSPAGAEELYKLITGILDNKISHFDPTVLMSVIGSVGKAASDTISGVFAQKYGAASSTEIARAQAEAQALIEIEKSKNRQVIFIGAAIVLLVFGVAAIFVFKKK